MSLSKKQNNDLGDFRLSLSSFLEFFALKFLKEIKKRSNLELNYNYILFFFLILFIDQ